MRKVASMTSFSLIASKESNISHFAIPRFFGGGEKMNL
jgi:hypothetical protein